VGEATKTISSGSSDVGKRRSINEDAYCCDDELGFYVVADGVGGHAKGEVASQETVEQLQLWMGNAADEIKEHVAKRSQGDPDAQWEIRRLLESGIQSACYMVFGMAELDPSKRGMSTTCSALLVRDGFAYAAHVGDSRVYRVREGRVLQITEDHTLINYKVKHGLLTPEQAAHARGKNVITRAVGHKDYVQIDTADVDTKEGDRFLLCSDGLHDYIHNPNEVIDLVEGSTIWEKSKQAVAFANGKGGKDNITAVIVETVDQKS